MKTTAHTWETHSGCDKPMCVICDGGLKVCTVCTAAEGSLTTECPGREVSGDMQDRVQAGEIDFAGGHWVTK